MTPERIPRKKISHGEAVYRRRLLAEARQKGVFNIDQHIIDKNQAQRRLTEINQYLSPEDQTLSVMDSQQQEQTRTELEIERIWVQFKLELITPADKQRLLAAKFDEVEKKPALYDWLTKNEHGLSMAEKIRDKVMPPTRIAGYYTKR